MIVVGLLNAIQLFDQLIWNSSQANSDENNV